MKEAEPNIVTQPPFKQEKSVCCFELCNDASRASLTPHEENVPAIVEDEEDKARPAWSVTCLKPVQCVNSLDGGHSEDQ